MQLYAYHTCFRGPGCWQLRGFSQHGVCFYVYPHASCFIHIYPHLYSVAQTFVDLHSGHLGFVPIHLYCYQIPSPSQTLLRWVWLGAAWPLQFCSHACMSFSFFFPLVSPLPKLPFLSEAYLPATECLFVGIAPPVCECLPQSLTFSGLHSHRTLLSLPSMRSISSFVFGDLCAHDTLRPLNQSRQLKQPPCRHWRNCFRLPHAP